MCNCACGVSYGAHVMNAYTLALLLSSSSSSPSRSLFPFGVFVPVCVCVRVFVCLLAAMPVTVKK